MTERSGTQDAILDAAERMARTGGYNAFSFRDVAKAVGIKAASVHYHFPGKDELGAAVARRYTDRFMAGLGAPDDRQSEPEHLLQRYVAAYRSSLVDDGLMCLCGMFGAEIAHLPESVSTEARKFFEANIDWLMAVYGRRDPARDGASLREDALRTIAVLEGALILARSLGDAGVFDTATRSLSD